MCRHLVTQTKSMSALLNKIISRKRALLASVLFLMTVIILWWGLQPSQDIKSSEPRVQPVVANQPRSVENNHFSVEVISDIDRVISSVQPLGHLNKPTDQSAPINMAILPHHTLAAERLAEFWLEIAQTTDPSVIVIVGPNHEELGEGVVQTTTGIWQTPVGDVRTDDELVQTLVRAKSATLEPDSFFLEHAIGIHTPYLAELFPNVPIVPVIGKSTAGQRAASSVLFDLNQALPADALLVVSMDFSHNLSAEQSEKMDQETILAIDSKQYASIDKFGPEHLDSSFGLDLALLWQTASGCERELIWHGQSAEFTDNPAEPGTSYLTYFCRTDERDPVVITAVGDVMLARGVEGVLQKMTVDNFVSEVKPYFQNTDIGLANLESVFSDDQTTTCSKTYCFKADPIYIALLDKLEIDHVSVSNNHNYDFGKKSFDDSMGYLSEANIAAVGGYQNTNVPVVTEINDQTVVMLAFDSATYMMNADQIKKEISQSPKGDILIVSFHWGEEY